MKQYRKKVGRKKGNKMGNQQQYRYSCFIPE